MTENPDAPFRWLDPLAIGRRWGEIALKSPKALTSSTRGLGQTGTTVPSSALYAWGQFGRASLWIRAASSRLSPQGSRTRPPRATAASSTRLGRRTRVQGLARELPARRGLAP